MMNYLRKWLPKDSIKKEDNLVPHSPVAEGRRKTVTALG